MKILSRYKLLLLVVSTILFAVIMTGCGIKKEEPKSGEDKVAEREPVEENPIVTMTMDNDKEVIIELFPNIAPNTVDNFISLIEKGHYDGLIFHRVMPGFMIQGGDPDGNGSGGPGYAIAGEFNSNDFENDLKHDRGVISMARSQHPDSAGSQFFIVAKNSPHLDNDYAGFGKVIEGIETVDEIVAVDRDPSDKPLEDQRIKTMVVDTKGHNYSEPIKQ